LEGHNLSKRGRYIKKFKDIEKSAKLDKGTLVFELKTRYIIRDNPDYWGVSVG